MKFFKKLSIVALLLTQVVIADEASRENKQYEGSLNYKKCEQLRRQFIISLWHHKDPSDMTLLQFPECIKNNGYHARNLESSDAGEYSSGIPLLHYSAGCKGVKAIDALVVDGGCDLEIKDELNFDCTALHTAALSGNLQSVKRLVALGAQVNAKDSNNATPIQNGLRSIINDKNIIELTQDRIPAYKKTVLVLAQAGADISNLTQEEKAEYDAIMQEAASK